MKYTIGILAALIFITVSNIAQPATSHTLIVHIDTVLDVNGYSKIEPQMFGLNAYEGANQFDAAGRYGNPVGYKFLNTYGVDSIGMAGNIPWVFPRGTNIFYKPLTVNEVDEWFANTKNGAWYYFTRYGGGDRYVQGRILPTIRKYTKSEPWLYIVGTTPFGMDKGRCPLNWERWSRAASGIIGLARRADPKFTYVHLLNEPNSHWFKSGHYGKDYADFFLQAATTIHKEHPGIKIGGPVLCWPPTWPDNKDWYTWTSYSKPLIDVANKELDFFDFHAYNNQAEGKVLEGEIHVVTAYAKSVFNKWLRSAITETNFRLSLEEWRSYKKQYNKRTLPLIRQTMSLLKHPDKVFVRQIHDFNNFTLNGHWRFRGDGDMKITPMMQFYKIMKPLRGVRLSVDNKNSAIMAEAAGNKTNIVVAVFNSSSNTTDINIKGLPDHAEASVTGEIIDATGLHSLVFNENNSISLPANSLVVVTYHLAKPIPLNKAIKIREYFASNGAVMKSAVPGIKNEYIIKTGSEISGKNENYLCFGTKGPAASGNWKVTVNNESHTINSPGPYYELKLTKKLQPNSQTVSIEQLAGESNKCNRISFVSLKSYSFME